MESTTNSAGNDVTLATSAGGIQLVSVSVGEQGDISVTSAGGITEDGDAATVVSGGGLSLSSAGGIDVDTAVVSISAVTTGSGEVVIEESDGVELKSVVASDGSISVSAGGDMVATKVESTTNSAGNEVTLATSAGGIQLVSVSVGELGDVSVSSAAQIEGDGSGAVEITGGGLSLISAGGIDVDTAVVSISATATGSGVIVIEESDGLELKRVVASDGPISVSAGGAMVATRVESTTNSAGNDVTLADECWRCSVGECKCRRVGRCECYLCRSNNGGWECGDSGERRRVESDVRRRD